MQFFQCLTGISISVFLLFLSCKSSDKKPVNDIAAQLKNSNYDDRIKNIFLFLHQANFTLPTSKCKKYIILQTNLCNSCNKEALDSVLNKQRNSDTLLVFILASENTSIQEAIGKNYTNPIIFVDTFSSLKKYNLNFLRNLVINTCNEKIINWGYLY